MGSPAVGPVCRVGALCWDLRQRRLARGLTLRAVARAAGTAESNIAAYEQGSKTMGNLTESRLVSVIDAGSDSVIHSRRLLTVPAAAAALRHGLRKGWPTSDLLRLIRQMRSDASWVSSPRDRAAFFARPSTTGDPRWDAMLAGVVEDLALAGAFARSPFSLQVRGVFVDPDDLEYV